MIDILADKERRARIAQEQVDLQKGIRQNSEQIILQSMTTLLFFAMGMYYGQQNSIIVPLMLAPAIKCSTSKLTEAISQRQRQIKRLRQLSRE